MPIFLIVVVALIALLVISSVRVLNEYERAVMFTLGRFTGVRGPGLIILWPVIQRMSKVDLRVIVLNIPKQDVITRDNVSVKVNAVVYSASSIRPRPSSRSPTPGTPPARWRKPRYARCSASMRWTNCSRSATR
ncbi:Band 7 protein [mine drainage metagenome]|uniref:Band 7 protein n=1 Tax=mine drainage metagenome TaxID=410659 RepID=T1C5T9_9ZZZZ